MGRALRSLNKGFTIVEMLAALAVSGIVLALIATAVEQVAVSSEELSERSAGLRRRLVLRRMLHRDLQGISDPGSFVLTGQGLRFETSHSHLMDAPLPVTVSWSFDDREVVRSEKLESIGYQSSIVLYEGLESWNLWSMDAATGSWLNRSTQVQRGGDAGATALIMLLEFPDGKLEITERMPYVVLLKHQEN